jgi:hypothetical protein
VSPNALMFLNLDLIENAFASKVKKDFRISLKFEI